MFGWNKETVDSGAPIARWEIAVVAIATLVGAVLRFYNLPEIPPGLWYDEAINGLDALAIIREPGWPVFFSTENHMREPLYMYLEALGILAFGANATAIRAVSAIIGTATIPVVWWMARRMAGPRFALLTLLFFVPMRWHVHFSRLAFRTILAPLFCAAIGAFAMRAAQYQRPRDWAIVGALAALGLYTYLSMRLYLLGVLAWALWFFWAHRREIPTKQIGASILAAGAAFLIVFSLLGIDYIRHPDHFTGRQQEVSLVRQGAEGWKRVATQACDVLLMGAFRGDHVGKHNIPGPPQFLQTYLWSANGPENKAIWRDTPPEFRPDPHGTGLPLFDLVTGLVFYAGMGIILWFAFFQRSWPHRLIVLWTGFGLIASVFSFGAPNMLRLLLLAPVAAFALASAAELIWRLLAKRSSSLIASIAIAAFVCWYTVGETKRYFIDWPEHPDVYFEFNSNFAEVARYLRANSPATPVVVPDFLASAPTFAFEADAVRASIISDSRAFENQPAPEEFQAIVTRLGFPPVQLNLKQTYKAETQKEFAFSDGTVWAELVLLTKETPREGDPGADR